MTSILAPVQPSDSSSQKVAMLNAIDNAMAVASLFGWNQFSSLGLTWSYFGGTWPVLGAPAQVISSSISLMGSATNYIEADLMAASSAAVVLVNQTGFTPGRVPLYTVQCDGSGPILADVTDMRPWVLPVEPPFCGYQSISTTGGITSLSQLQASAKVLKFNGTLTSNAIIVGPLVTGAWFVVNQCTGAYTLTLQGITGASVVVDEGARALVYCDGTGYYAITGNASGYGPAGHGATETGAGFTIAAVGSDQVIEVQDPVAFPPQSYLLATDGTNTIVGAVVSVSGSNLTVQTVKIVTGASGNTMAGGAVVTFAGIPGTNGSNGHGTTTTAAGFTIADVGSAQTVAVGDATAFPVNAYEVISDGSNAILGQVTAVSGTDLTIKTIQLLGGAIGNTMASGASVAFSGPPAPIGAANAQTGTSYTLGLSDAINGVTMNNASANIVTIPANSAVPLPLGVIIPIGQIGAGQTSVTGASGVTVNNASSNNCRAQYSTIGIWQYAANSWLVVGDTQ